MSIRLRWTGLIALLGSVACSSGNPGSDSGTDSDAAPDGTDTSRPAGQCINGFESPIRGGTFTWGDIVVVCESQGTIEIRLPRPHDYPEGEVRLWHEVAEDSVAKPQTDFDGGNGKFTWPEGDTEDKVFSLTIRDDDEVEGDELLQLHLSRFAGNGYWNSYGDHMQVLIVDDDVDNGSQPFLVSNINSGKTEGSGVGPKVVFGGAVFFAADDGMSGVELWKSDGSPSGTVLVKDLVPGRAGSHPKGFTVSGNNLYFTASTADYGSRVLFRSDGTTDGTVPVAASGDPVSAEQIGADAQGVYFTTGNALWRAENSGTTEQVFDFASPPEHLVVSHNVAYLAADDGASGVELWRSDAK